MEVRESAYGSFTSDEARRPAVRAAILLGVAAAACSRGDSLDELLLGATRDLLFFGGDRIHRMGALGVCATLLSKDRTGDAIRLTVNRQASSSACAEFLACVAPRLDPDAFRAAVSAAAPMHEGSSFSWELEHLVPATTFLIGGAEDKEQTRTVVEKLRNGVAAIAGEIGGNEQRLVDRVEKALWHLRLRIAKSARDTQLLPVKESSWPADSLDHLCDPGRMVLAPQVLAELAELAAELDNATDDELFGLARDAAVAARLASAQHSIPRNTGYPAPK
jgi:hypothetical protein